MKILYSFYYVRFMWRYWLYTAYMRFWIFVDYLYREPMLYMPILVISTILVIYLFMGARS